MDRISGTSMGSLVGALYATGSTPAQMRAMAVSDAFTRVFTLQTPYCRLELPPPPGPPRTSRMRLPSVSAIA